MDTGFLSELKALMDKWNIEIIKGTAGYTDGEFKVAMSLFLNKVEMQISKDASGEPSITFRAHDF